MSHGVADARARCRVVATIEEALADATHAVGFTARPQEGRPRASWRERREILAARASDPDERVCFVFGAEVGGLVAAEVAKLAELVWLPTSDEHTSLNLAIAAGIVLSDLFVERPFRPRERGVKPLTEAARRFLVADLTQLFGEHVALTPAAAADIRASIERVFGRADLEDRDARAWHLMTRALGSTLTPRELGLVVNTKRERRRKSLGASRAKPRVLVSCADPAERARALSLAAQRGFTVTSAADLAELETELARAVPDLVALLGAFDAVQEASLAAVCDRAAPNARVVRVPDLAALAHELATVQSNEP
jgi:tRNA C32,U32 (ribose-2'-O)-methylase TrmJ